MKTLNPVEHNPNPAIVEFYDFIYQDVPLQERLSNPPDYQTFKASLLEEGAIRGYQFTMVELEKTFDGMGDRSHFDHVEFDNDWIKTIVRFGWVPKGYSR